MALPLSVQFAIFALCSLVAAEGQVRYDGYHLLSTVPHNDHQVKLLADLQNDPEVDFWIEPRVSGHPVHIFVGPEKVKEVESNLAEMGLDAEVVLSDAQSLIKGNDLARMSALDSPFASGLDWKNYYPIDTINAWLKEMAQKYNKIATIITAGKSTEGRDLMGLRIAHKPNQPILFIEAGIHAREWITPATATWFIQQALNTTSDLIKSYEWHVFPSVNPDGYAYTQKDRLWRKTRSKASGSCIGIDENRNYPYKWQGSNSPCSETYSGPTPASEPETKGLTSYLKGIADRTRVYISLHSYSQLLMYPWGYTSQRPTNDKRFNEIAGKAAKKLSSRFGTKYTYGPIATTIYPAAGNTIDFAYSLNITYPFVFELRDQGKYGFLLPKEQIIPTALETFDAVNVILEEAKK